MRLPLAILRGAALLVPGPQREGWLAEWQSELWYVRQNAAVFCLGAFRDALWIRSNTPSAPARLAFFVQSPQRCLLLLAILAAANLFFAFRLPLPRALLLPSPYRDARNLAILSVQGHKDASLPTVRFEQYQSLARHTGRRFTGLAFYRPVRTRVETAGLSIAVASNSLFELLQIPIPAASQPAARLVLSDAVWRKYFHAESHIVGRVFQVSGQAAVVAGVIPRDSWILPGRVEAWLLQDESLIPQQPPGAEGFVLGRLRAPSPDSQWTLSLQNDRDSYDRIVCTSLAQGRLFLPYSLSLLVCLLVVPAITPLALGDYPAGPGKLRRWIFLGMKLALLAPIVYCGSLNLASLVAAGFMGHGFVIGNILALRWVVADQRRRCPVCLRLLTNPTRIGGPAHAFLDWYGDELICTRGHGLLYVPEIHASCYSAQHWQPLDSSWSSLFSYSRCSSS
jgi:hypothetical protein